MDGYLCNTDDSTICLNGFGGFMINSENGGFLPWRLKVNLTIDESYNISGAICRENEEKGIRLELDPGFFTFDEDIIWSNGKTGREIIIKDTGSYYANFKFIKGNIGITDTFTVKDHYDIIENPVLGVTYPEGASICYGDEGIFDIQVLNDNGNTYTYENLTLDRQFDQKEKYTEEGEYLVRVTDNNGCFTDTTLTGIVITPHADDICMVTVDKQSGKNLILWSTGDPDATESYRVLRGLSKTEIGTSLIGDSNSMIDSTSKPEIMAYRYYLETIDTCGNAMISEISHKTIHLTANRGVSGEVNLIWQPYEGLELFQYNFYRSTDSVNFQMIGGMEYDPSISQYSDYNPPAGKLYYQIGIEGNFDCSAGSNKKSTQQEFNEIFSNVYLLQATGSEAHTSLDANLRVYPNPANEYLIIEYKGNKNVSSVRLLNLMGGLVSEKQMNSSAFRMNLEPGIASGIYLIQIQNDVGLTVANQLIRIQ
jgi:hypothetical protein